MERLKALGGPPRVKNSKMSMTLIQNYVLMVCLMKNITIRHIAGENTTSDNLRAYKAQIRHQIE